MNIEGIRWYDYSMNRETRIFSTRIEGRYIFRVYLKVWGEGSNRVRREIARVWPSSRISIRIYLGSVISRTRADLCYISCRTLSNTPKDNRLLRRNNLPMYDKLVSLERCSLLVFVLSSPPFIVKLHWIITDIELKPKSPLLLPTLSSPLFVRSLSLSLSHARPFAVIIEHVVYKRCCDKVGLAACLCVWWTTSRIV